MDNFANNKNTERSENMIAGIAGAFLFSLAGGVVYFLLYLFGYLASISGLVGVVCAVKGYEIFSSKLSKKGIVIATVIAFAVIISASYLGLAYDIYDAYKSGFELGETDFSLSFPESVRAVPFFLEEPEIRNAYTGDLLMGLFFCLIGCGSYVRNKLKNTTAAKSKTNADIPYPGSYEHMAEQRELKEEEQTEDNPPDVDDTDTDVDVDVDS